MTLFRISVRACVILPVLATIVLAVSQEDEKISGYSCSACHVPEDWSVLRLAAFDHDSTTFPLRGAHALIACAVCHTGETIRERHLFENAGSACNSCHTDIHETLLGTSCESCHSPDSWQDAGSTFNHDKTLFPLIGSHVGLSCESCHFDYSGGTLSGLVPDCGNCHQSAKARADNLSPDHAFFSVDCEKCHAVFDWADIFFDHALTDFPLTGKHAATDCGLCHDSGYTGTPNRCEICHIEQYNDTTSPIHNSEIYLASDCELCHDTETFETSLYSHLPAPSVCSLCHVTDLTSANQTVAGHDGLPNDCLTCHTTLEWTDLIFNHDTAGFPLEGIHLTTACEDCHADGFLNTPAQCQDCHLIQYEQTTQPPHAEFGFLPEDCALCHTALGWVPANFDHGGITTGCTECHSINGGWDPLPVIDHNSSPKLGSTMQDCIICHSTTSSWQTVSFSNSRHDGNLNEIYFDIYSGEHNGEWGASCTDNCHVFGTFDTFSCYDNCHTNKHSRSKMSDEHCEGGSNCSSCVGTNGYWPVSLQYSDGDWSIPNTFTQCYICHPDGSKNGACGDEGDRIQPIGKWKKVKKTEENKGKIK